MAPVLVLPIADLAILAQSIGPVVPRLATRGNVRLSVLLILRGDRGENLGCEKLAGLCEGHDVGKVCSHRGDSFLDDVLLSHMREMKSSQLCQENVNASFHQTSYRYSWKNLGR